MYRICLTGHRPKDVAQYMKSGSDIYSMSNPYWERVIGRLCAIIRDQLNQHPEGLELHSGLALGADTAWAFAIVLARKHFGSDLIRFIADCPLPTQASRWSAESRKIWHELINTADRVDYTSQGPYTPSVMERRNQQMILPSDLCIAFWNGKTYGGTYNGVRDAKGAVIPILRVDPAQI